MSDDVERRTSLLNDNYSEGEGEEGEEGERKEGDGDTGIGVVDVKGETGGDVSVGAGEGGGGRKGGGEVTEEKFSEVNLATPQSDLPSLEFFDHNVTSSDSSDTRVLSVRWEGGEEGGGDEGGGEKGGGEEGGGDEGGGDEGDREGEEVVRSKTAWDRQKETAKLLDLESPVDTRRDMSAEKMEDTRDLKATITHREKQGSRTDSYIMYRIVTETTRASHLYEESQYEVWRRYRDFEWLRAQIERTYTTLILPPLPGKQVSRYFDHMSEEFLEERQKALSKFLWRLTVHPYFSFSPDLKVFLTSNAEDFAVHMQESQGSKKLLDKVSTSVRQAHTALMLKDVDPEFAKQAKYFSELGERMSVMERIAVRLHSERETLQLAHDDFSVSLFHWAGSERAMTQPLQKLASCVEKCSHALKGLNEANTYSMMVTVKEYQLYSVSAVAAIRRRDSLQLEEERSVSDRDKKKRYHEEATAAGKVQRVTKLADDLEKVGFAAEKALDHLSEANEQLRVDVEKWHEAKNRDVCQFMRQFATNHVDYHQKCFSEWESALQRLRAVSASPAPAGEILREVTSSSSRDSEDSDS